MSFDFGDLDPLGPSQGTSPAASQANPSTGNAGHGGAATTTQAPSGTRAATAGTTAAAAAAAVGGANTTASDAEVDQCARVIHSSAAPDDGSAAAKSARAAAVSSFRESLGGGPPSSAQGPNTVRRYVTCVQLARLLRAMRFADERVASTKALVHLILDFKKGFPALMAGKNPVEQAAMRRVLEEYEDELKERKRRLAGGSSGGGSGSGGGGFFSSLASSIKNAARKPQKGAATGSLIDMDAKGPSSAGKPAQAPEVDLLGSLDPSPAAPSPRSGAAPAIAPARGGDADADGQRRTLLAAYAPVTAPLFAELREHLRSADFGDKRRVLHTASRAHHFTTTQLRELMDVLDFAEDRIVAVQLLAPRVLDRGAFFANVASPIGDSQERSKIDEAWANSQPPSLPTGITAENVLAAAGAGAIVDLIGDPGAPDDGGAGGGGAGGGGGGGGGGVAVGAHPNLMRARTESTVSIDDPIYSVSAAVPSRPGSSSADPYAALRDRSVSMPLAMADGPGGSSDAGGSVGGGGGGRDDDLGGSRSRVTSQAGAGFNAMQSPIAARDLEDLVQTLRNAGFEDKTPHLKQAAMFHYFTCAQLTTIMATCDFENERVAAAKLIGPKLIDREVIFEVVSRITDDSERAQVAAALAGP